MLEFIHYLSHHKLRTALTVLAIALGVFTVTAVGGIAEYLEGFVCQQFNLLSHLTALDNVCLPLRYTDAGRREARARARELLEHVGLADRITHRPLEMSGGEQQRVAVARALINRPAIVLADEPTGELDSATAGEIMTLMRSLNREGQTFVIVTHDPQVAAQTDRSVYLQDGRVVREERRAQVR